MNLIVGTSTVSVNMIVYQIHVVDDGSCCG